MNPPLRRVASPKARGTGASLLGFATSPTTACSNSPSRLTDSPPADCISHELHARSGAD